jgi:hypothetical protein
MLRADLLPLRITSRVCGVSMIAIAVLILLDHVAG